MPMFRNVFKCTSMLVVRTNTTHLRQSEGDDSRMT